MKLLGTLSATVLLLTNATSVLSAQELPQISTQLHSIHQSLLHKITSELTDSHIPKNGLQRLSGKVSDVVIHSKISDYKREYVLFSYSTFAGRNCQTTLDVAGKSGNPLL
ncbi:hypothetical protein [Brevibacillus agri]|uniref:hypothetical protein n=1 Tax=Brevibacillus agri TaxID=51101 RepID=UPI0028682591|nr:hypothetical protein [Brevibacillus agri]